MATTNLGLETINASDYVSPTPINNNMEKIDKLGIDYVVEQGTSGEWWYRKWNSGRAECGVDTKSFGQQSMKPWNALYTTSELSFGAYPFGFSSRPFTIISYEGDSDSEAYRSSYVRSNATNSTTLSPKFAIIDSVASTMSPVCGIYVCGRYK